MFATRIIYDQDWDYRPTLSGMFLACCLFLACPLSGQSPRFFRHFTEKDGLSSDHVTCILREPKGYLWVGTNYGLNRYDGRQFKPYLPNNGPVDQTICNEYITALAQDANGYIWIATRKGLSRYNPHTRRFQTWVNTGNNDGSLPNDLVSALWPDGNRLWVACDNRDLACLDLHTGVFQQFPWKKFTETAIPGSAGKDYKTIYSISQKSKQQLWLHTNLGLMIFDKESGGFELCPPQNQKLPTFQLEDLNCPEHLLLGFKNDNILCYNHCRSRWSEVKLSQKTKTDDESETVSQMKQDGGRYWLLTSSGLYYLEAKTREIKEIAKERDNSNHVPEGSMLAYYADFQGLRWFGGTKGLWLLDPSLQNFNFLSLDTSPNGAKVNRYGRLLDIPELGRRFIIDHHRGQLLVFEKGHVVKTLPLGGPSHILQRDPAGRVWVSGGMNLYQLDPKTLVKTPFPIHQGLFGAGPDSFLSDFEIDASGNYWFAGNDCGILLYHPSTKIWEKPGPSQEFIARNINSLYADPAGRFVWIGSEDYGLFRYNDQTKNFVLFQPDIADPEHSLGAYMVRDVAGYRNGYLWIATDPGGLSRYDYHAGAEQAFINYNTTSGLPSNQVCSMVRDASGRLWAGTTKGLVYMSENGAIPLFWNKNSGLRNDNLEMPLILGADGNIYMGGSQGMEYFCPDSLIHSNWVPEIQLNSFKVFDNELTGTFQEEIVLHWRDNFFTVDFASGNFSMPERTRYSAYLEGFEKNPQFLGNEAHRAFTNVPPGHYTLRLRAMHNDGTAGVMNIRLIIKPPFWQTWWFQLLAAGLLLAAVWGIYRYRIGQIRREEMLKTEFNRRLSKVEMSALRAQMNPHFVFNCLNSINRFILVNEPEAASEYLTKFSRLIRLILDNSRTETVPLNKELDALRLYIEMEAMRFEGRFDYEIDIDPNLQTEHLEVPPLLIQPFVENAIWHGLMHREECGQLAIRIGETQDAEEGITEMANQKGRAGGLKIQIEDNGIGRARAQELKSKSAQTHKSQGMQLTEERLTMIRTLYGVQADIFVEDLFTPNGIAAGTRVTILIT